MPTLGPMELMIIFAIVLIVFGGGKLAGVGKSLGTAINEFKGAVTADDKEKVAKDDSAEKTDAE